MRQPHVTVPGERLTLDFSGAFRATTRASLDLCSHEYL
jgi:hypothetical protein